MSWQPSSIFSDQLCSALHNSFLEAPAHSTCRYNIGQLGALDPQVLVKRLKIIGSTLRSRPREQKVEIIGKFSNFALHRFEAGEFKPQVDISFPLAEAGKAHQHMADAKNKGKIILLT